MCWKEVSRKLWPWRSQVSKIIRSHDVSQMTRDVLLLYSLYNPKKGVTELIKRKHSELTESHGDQYGSKLSEKFQKLIDSNSGVDFTVHEANDARTMLKTLSEWARELDNRNTPDTTQVCQLHVLVDVATADAGKKLNLEGRFGTLGNAGEESAGTLKFQRIVQEG